MINIKSHKEGGIAQLERIRLEEQHKIDSIFQTIQCPKFIPTSSRIDFSLKDCIFTPNHQGVVFGHNLNLPSVRCQQYKKIRSSTSIVTISSPRQSFHMKPPSNKIYYGCKCSPHLPEEAKMDGMKRLYPFSPGSPPVPLFRCKKCCGSPVSRSNEFTSCSNKCSINVEEGNVLKREVISKSKALNGDFQRLALLVTTLPHSREVNRCSLTDPAQQCLHLFNYVPSRVAVVEHTRSSGLSISLQQPSLRFIHSAKVQIVREGTHGSGF